jgi:hypothetical protein
MERRRLADEEMEGIRRHFDSGSKSEGGASAILMIHNGYCDKIVCNAPRQAKTHQ